MASESKNPCMTCGACCAYFRPSFYWAEGDDVSEGGVPVELTVPLGPFRRRMLGSAGPNPRCVALRGEVGSAVSCSIYERRSSVCRDFRPSLNDGSVNPACDKARANWQLPPLTPAVWNHEESCGNPPEAAGEYPTAPVV